MPASPELNRVAEEIVDSPSRSRLNEKAENQKQIHESRSLLTKTYSFKRMLSFRGSFRSRDSGNKARRQAK